MKINVIGLGYIGLPTAAVFADGGAKVVGVDKNEDVVKTINTGNIHIEEPGLRDIIERVVAENQLIASMEPEHETFLLLQYQLQIMTINI